jgi:dTDP-4-dehydrorhamnose 3,5-epimerase-like enzyme
LNILKYEFAEIGDSRGTLVAIEQNINIPFEIKRVYYMYNTTKDVRRGKHSHTCLEQILICICGSCTVILDDGKEKAEVVLNKKFEGLYIGPNTWREMYNFSDDAVLMVLASEHYSEDDYIRDYDVFQKSISR